MIELNSMLPIQINYTVHDLKGKHIKRITIYQKYSTTNAVLPYMTYIL